MARLQVCVECWRLTEQTRCPEHQKATNQRIRRRGAGFYNEERWKRFSARFRRVDHPLCANPDHNANCTLVTEHTDHIVPVPDGCSRALFYAGPFQPLCVSCHSLKTAREIQFGGSR